MRKLDKCWRLFATALCFAFFGLGGLVLATCWLPLFRLFYRHDEAKRQAACRATVHYAFKCFIGLMRFVGVVKVSTKNVQLFQNLQGKVIIANHPSLVDVVVLISLVRNANCVVKQSLWNNPFTRGVLRNSGYISNSDPDGLIDDCKASLQQGHNLIIFPEGTRTRPGETLSFQRGAANIALRSNAHFLMSLIRVTPPGLTKGWPWYRVPDSCMQLQLVVLGEFDTSAYQEESISKGVRHLTRDIEQKISEELVNFDQHWQQGASCRLS